jgi:hypothetical protein
VKIPSTNIQAPEKLQIPDFKAKRASSVFVLGISLDVGA